MWAPKRPHGTSPSSLRADASRWSNRRRPSCGSAAWLKLERRSKQGDGRHAFVILEDSVGEHALQQAIRLGFGIAFFDGDQGQDAGSDSTGQRWPGRFFINMNTGLYYPLQQCNHFLTMP